MAALGLALYVLVGAIVGGALAWIGHRLFGRWFRRRRTPSQAHPAANAASVLPMTEDERLWEAEMEDEKS